jgi:hypothetical protein
LRYFSDLVFLEILIKDLMGNPKLGPGIIKDIEISTVSHSAFIPLIDCIIQVEYICANQGIITLNNQGKLTQFAMIGNGVINVVWWFSGLLVGDNLDFLHRNITTDDVRLNILSSLVL